MTAQQFYNIAWTLRENIMGWLKAEYQLDEPDAEDIFMRYINWGAAREWQEGDTHTFERAIYRCRQFINDDRRTKGVANLVVLGERGEGHSEGGIPNAADLLTVLATESSAASLADMLGSAIDEDYADRVSRLHLLTETQREVVIAYLLYHTQEDAAAALGIERSALTKTLQRAHAVLEADNPDPRPHTWEPHEENPQWCRPGYRQRTPWFDADHDDYCQACTARDRDAMLARFSEASDPSPEQRQEMRRLQRLPYRFFGHVHHCGGRE